MSVHERYRNRGFECVCGNLRMAARAVTRMYDERLQPAGLRSTQLAVLWATCALGPATVQSIAGRMSMEQSTLIRNLRVLERDALVTIRTGADRRERIVRVTAKGRRRFERAMPLWESAQRQVSRTFNLRRPDSISGALLELARAFGSRN